MVKAPFPFWTSGALRMAVSALLADYPMWEPEGEIERFVEIDLTDEERRDIL